MNKIIPTDKRVFMALVGPSGSGKTQLIFQMLVNGTFHPQFVLFLVLFPTPSTNLRPDANTDRQYRVY